MEAVSELHEARAERSNGRLPKIKARDDKPTKAKPPEAEKVAVSRPNMVTASMRITGTAPYLQCRFPAKAMNQIMAKQQLGDQTGKGKAKRPPRDYETDYLGSQHKTEKGKFGIPASAFRAACISACRLIGFKMTIAKMSIFIIADDYDVEDATPLVLITGKPEKHISMGRNSDGTPDVRVRTIFKEWSASLRVKFDADQFKLADVVNLIMRVGIQVGVGEGRPDSKNSVGMGYGTFDVELAK